MRRLTLAKRPEFLLGRARETNTQTSLSLSLSDLPSPTAGARGTEVWEGPRRDTGGDLEDILSSRVRDRAVVHNIN